MTRYDKYINRDKVKNERRLNYVLTLEEISGLIDMVKDGVYPDRSFGDDHCIVWEMIKRAISHTKGN